MNENNTSLATKKMTFSMAITTPTYQRMINTALNDPKRASRFISGITSAVAVNPLLQDCDASTILSGALLGESLGLSPSPQLGQYYLVPFECKTGERDGHGNEIKVKKAQFQLGYKGYIQLALRSGYYRKLNVIAIKEGELMSYDPLNEEIYVKVMSDELARETAKTTGYYAFFEYLNGFRKCLYWSREKMEAHALRYSKGYAAKKGYTFWEKDFDAMGFKTMLRQLISKWGVMSIELQQAYEADTELSADDSGVDLTTPQLPQHFDQRELNEYVEEVSGAMSVGSNPPAAPKQVSLNDL